MQNRPADCEFIEGDEKTNIFQPEDNYIPLINSPGIFINSSCPLTPEKPSGTLLIHFESCNVEINKITYEGHPRQFWENVTIHITSFSRINYTADTHSYTLKRILEYKFDNTAAIRTLENNTNTQYMVNLTFLTIQGIIILIMATYITCKLRGFKFNITASASEPETTKLQLLFPPLHPDGEGVTAAPTDTV